MNRKQSVMVGILILINLIVFLFFVAIGPVSLMREFKPSSSMPQISIDEKDNAHIHFISYQDQTGNLEKPNNIAYVKIGTEGEIIEGPEFVNDFPMSENQFDYSERNITDPQGNTHYFTVDFDPWGGDDAHIYYTKVDGNGTRIIDNKTIVHHRKVKNSHSPAIFGIKLRLDSQDNIHIAWYINSGPGNYYGEF